MKINSVNNISFHANEQTTKKINPAASAAYSAICPGLGQFGQNRRKEGWFFFAGSATLNIASSLLNSKQAKNIKEIPNVDDSILKNIVSIIFDESGISNLYKSIKNSSKSASRFLSVAPIVAATVAAGFWVYNVIDAFRGAKKNSKPTNE